MSNVLLWQEMGSAAEVCALHIRMFSYLLLLTNVIQCLNTTHCSSVRHQCFYELSKWLPFSRTHARGVGSFSKILRSKREHYRTRMCPSSGLVSTNLRTITKSFQMVCLVSQCGAHTFACTCEFNLHQCVAASDSQQW